MIAKIVIWGIIFLFPILKCFSQEKLDDMGRIVLNTYIPVQTESIPDGSIQLLETRLSQIASNHGMGGSTLNPRFIISAKISLINKNVIPGPPILVSQNFEISLFIADAIEQVIFSNTSINLTGVGRNEAAAFNDGLRRLNINHPEILAFVERGKSSIISYYNTNCELILREALFLSETGEYDQAIYNLFQIPDIAENCYFSALDTIQFIFQKKIDQDCLIKMRRAESEWMSQQNLNGAQIVAQIISEINPFSNCQSDVAILISRVEKKLNDDEKKAWEFKMKKYNDELELKHEALRMAEEEMKRQVALQRERSRQEYEIVRADREAGGLRGVMSTIAQIKLASWRDSASGFIQDQRQSVDYSKFKF